MAVSFTVDADKSSAVPAGSTSQRKKIVGTLVATGGDGAAAGDIPASLFGLTRIESVELLHSDGNDLVVAASPSYDGTSILTKAAGTAAPADLVADTYACAVIGW